MFQGYTLNSAGLKSCQQKTAIWGQINNNSVLNQEALLSSLQVVTDYHLIINRSWAKTPWTHTAIAAIIFFLPSRHIPTAQPVRTPTATEMESVTLMRLKKTTPLRPPTFSNREKTDVKQKQGDDSQAHADLLLFSQKAQARRNAVNHKRAHPRLTEHLIFRDGVNKNNYDNSDCGLHLGQAGVLVNGSDCCCSTQVVSWDLWSQIWPRPALIWDDDDSISPQKKRAPAAAAKCVYSCTTSNIHQMPSLQCVMWGNQHFTGRQMMSKAVVTWQCRKENGSNTHKRFTGFFLVSPDRWGTSYVKILILLKYLKQSNDSKAQNKLSSVNDPPPFFTFQPFHLNQNCSQL